MTQQAALVGIDVGTTNMKVTAFDLRGEVLASVSHPLEAIRPAPGQGEYDADALFDEICALLREITGRMGAAGRRVEGLAVASMAETAFPLDATGHPLRAGLAWWDTRSRPQAERLAAQHGQSNWYRLAGMHLSALVGVAKLLYLREAEPEVFESIATWANVADWVAFRLTGNLRTDRTLGCRLGLMDVTRGEWSDELLSVAGIDPSIFAPLVNSGEQVGEVTPEAAARTGLPVGMPVGAGGMDHPVAAFGAGVARPGEVLDSMGTTEALLGVMSRAVLTEEMADKRYQQGVFVVPGTNFVVGGLPTSGSAVDWLYSMLWGGSIEDRDYSRLVDAARDADPGAGGLLFLPFLLFQPNGVRSETASGALLGIRLETRQQDITRALLEGIACTVQSVVEGMGRDFGLDPARMVAVGGGTRNPVLMEVKAALAGGSIAVGQDESATRGAAMLGGMASGVFDGYFSAIEQMVAPRTSVTADLGLTEVYRRLLKERFEPVHRALLPHYELFGRPLGT